MSSPMLRPWLMLLTSPLAVAAEPPVEASPHAAPADEPDPAAPPLTPAQARREARKQARKARWDGPLLPKEGDFLLGDIELKARLAFNATDPGPFSLVTALAGWNELAITVDAAAFAWKDFTLGVGGTVHYGQSLVLGLVSGPISNYDEYRFGWSMWDAGGVARVTAHYTGLSSVDPYLVVGLGASAFRLDARVDGWSPDLASAAHATATVRGELGGGLTWLMKGDWVIGVELRYLFTSQTNPTDRLFLRNGDETAVFVFASQHRPPKGFSWSVQAGYRF